MVIILSKNCLQISGSLISGSGFVIKSKEEPDGRRIFYTVRTAPYSEDYSDSLHADFILSMARMALNDRQLAIKDICITVRELIDARASLVTGSPLCCFEPELRNYTVRVWCNTITLRLRKVKPGSVLNAKDILLLKDILNN